MRLSWATGLGLGLEKKKRVRETCFKENAMKIFKHV